MKTVKTILLTIMTSVLVLSSTCSCTTSSRSNNRTAHKEINDVAFHKVDISSFFKVTFRKGDQYKVKVQVSERFDPYLVSEINNGKLTIGFDRMKRGFFSREDENLATVDITAPSFSEIELSGAVTMKLEGEWQLDEVSFDVSGAAKFQGNGIRAKELEIEQSGASSIRANIAVDKLDIEASGASKMELDALCQFEGSQLTVDISGASKVNVAELPFQKVKVDASGAAKAQVYPLNHLRADVSGAANVYYVGTSKTLQTNVEKSGAGSISKL